MRAIEKVIVPKEVADSIEYAVKVHSSLTNVMDDVFNYRGGSDYKIRILADYFEGNEHGLMSALVNGHEIEKSPEEQLREIFEMNCSDSWDRGFQTGISCAIDTLGITIEGINA